jgi:DNA-binding transcriptional LysR family regulator
MSLLAYMEYFAAVVECGSLTAAAERLGLSKPAVSKQLGQLELRLGVRLLNRTTRRMHLTEAGEQFYRHCRRALDEAMEAEQAVAPLQTEPQGQLRISAPQCLALSLFKQALPAFQLRYPKIALEISISGRYVDLVKEGFDAGLRIGELEDSSLIARRIAPVRSLVCAAPGYWQRHGKPRHPRELAGHNCLIYSERQQPRQWGFADKGGEALRVAVGGNLVSDDASLLLAAARRGQGVVMGPAFMYADAVSSGELEPALEDYARPASGLYVVYPNAPHLASKVRVFVDFMLEAGQALH